MKRIHLYTALILILLVPGCAKKKHEEPEPIKMTGAVTGLLFVYDTEYALPETGQSRRVIT